MSYSVLLAARNEEKSIGFALEALCNQSVEPSQILVGVNDSSDRTAEIARSYSGVSVFEYEEAGKARTLNKLFEHVNSEHLVFTDADVVLFPRACERVAQSLELGNAAVCTSSIEVSRNSSYKRRPIFRGGLYGVNFSDIQDMASKKNLRIFPENIIAEDFLVSCVLRSNLTDSAEINLPSYAVMTDIPVVSSLRRDFRLAISSRQVFDEFPQLKYRFTSKKKHACYYFSKFIEHTKDSDKSFPFDYIDASCHSGMYIYRKLFRKCISTFPLENIDGSWQSPERNPELLQFALANPEIQKYF